MKLRYEFRCGAPTGRDRQCRKLLGTAETSDSGYGFTFSGGWLYPTDDIKDVYRFNCPKHGQGAIFDPRFLDRREPRKKPYTILVVRET